MSHKRGADPFIKPDPDAKRVKREGGDGNFSLSSIPMAPPPAPLANSTPSAMAPKFEGGDRKPLGPAPNFGGGSGSTRKRKFFGNSIKVVRGYEYFTCHFNNRAMVVDVIANCAYPKQWVTTDVEQEIFRRLNKAKFDIQPSEDWGFLDRKFFALHDKKGNPQSGLIPMTFKCTVNVERMSLKKDDSSPPQSKQKAQSSETKSEHFW